MSEPAIEGALMVSTAEPRGRIRIQHSRTQRGGWGYETTVELEWCGDRFSTDQWALDRIGTLLGAARALGETERDIRNARDMERRGDGE